MNNEKACVHDACKSVQLYLDKKGKDLTSKRKIIIEKLLQLTLDSLENDCTYPIQFSTKELYTAEYRDTKSISEWHNSIQEALKTDKDLIVSLSRNNGSKYYFDIRKEKRQGLTSLYSLEAVPVPDERYALPRHGIRFEPDDIRLPFWIKWFNGFTIIGWKKWLFILLVVLFTSVIVFSLILINPMYYESGFHWFKSAFFFTFLAGWVYWLFRPFRQAIDYRIVDAPWIFLPFDTYYGQLESTGDSNNNRYFRIIVYKSTCPVCGARVDVTGGKKNYPHRMIGRCRMSPAEHIFSFDPETKIGLPLNPEFNAILSAQEKRL